MQRIAPHLGLARRVRVSNVWLLRTRSGENYLIDTGHPLERPALRRDLYRAGLRGPGDVKAVVLTHRHSDHAGNAAWLRLKFQCPVLCHAADAPFLTGQRRPPMLTTRKTSLWARALCHLEDRFPARVEVDEVLEHGQSRWGFRVFWAPGHTDGSVLLHHEDTHTLFSGDSIIGGPPPFRFVERMRLSFADFSENIAKARASVQQLVKELPYTETLCAGHGPAVSHDTDAKLRKLARRDGLRPRRAARYPAPLSRPG